MALKRYAQLKRKKPILRVNSIVSSGSNSGISSKQVKPSKKKSIGKISISLAKKLKIYYNIRVVYLTLFQFCKAQLPGCAGMATDIHHKWGRGIYLCVIKYFLPVCRACHDRIGINSKEAIKLGLSSRRNSQDCRYLQPHNVDTIRVLLKMKAKLYITN